MNARTARRKRIIRVRSVEHQMAEANLARAKADYDEGTMVARFAALYGNALGRRGVFG